MNFYLAAVSFDYPIEFWAALALLLGLVIEALRGYPKNPWAIPAMLVYATIAAWYLGNLVKDGADAFRAFYGEIELRFALSQIVLFLLLYRILVRWTIPTSPDLRVGNLMASQFRSADISRLLWQLILAWALLFSIGVAVAGGNILAILWPPAAGEKIGMFGRGGIGSGTDFLASTGGYVYQLTCALFGVIFVLAKKSQRRMALLMVIITWPYFWFDRTRNVMLAMLLPAVFCYWVATKSALWKKTTVFTCLVWSAKFVVPTSHALPWGR